MVKASEGLGLKRLIQIIILFVFDSERLTSSMSSHLKRLVLKGKFWNLLAIGKELDAGIL